MAEKATQRVPNSKLHATALSCIDGVTDEHAHRVFAEYERIMRLYGPDSQAERAYRRVPIIQKALAYSNRLRQAMSCLRKAYIASV